MPRSVCRRSLIAGSYARKQGRSQMWGWIDLHAAGAALAVSVAALCVSALSLWLTWRRDRRSENATNPLVEIHVAPYPIEPGVHAVTLAVTNQRDHHIYLRNYTVERPRSAAFVAHHERSQIEPPTIFRDKRSRIGIKTVCLTARGTPGAQWSNIRYLDIGSSITTATVRFRVEFDVIDKAKRTISYSIKKTIGKVCNPPGIAIDVASLFE
jgi:hypothetical protein